MSRLTYKQLFVGCVLFLAVVTAVIAYTGWDLQFTRHFFRQGQGFPIGKMEPWRFLYRFGEWPATILTVGAALVLVAGFVRPALARYRRQALFLVLLTIIAPGLLVNSLFKNNWGRPRPRDVDQFGGTMAFHQPWQPGPAPKNASFPAGHPTAAFYMSAPYFILRKKRPRQARIWLWGGFVFGCIMGAARIIQGGHFLSDVVWSAGFVYLTALLLAAWLKPDESAE